MWVRYGNYTFNENGCALRSSTRIITAPETGRPLRYLTRCSIEGWLEGDSQAELSLEEAALRLALLRPYQDLRLLTDSGATTSVSLINAQSISGVRVLAFDFPGDTGAEFATLRRFTAEVEAEFLIPGTENVVLSFTEQLSFTGNGGPDVVLRVPINTPDIVEQEVSPATAFYAVQSGQAVGHTRRPEPNPPKFPAAKQIGKQQQISEFGPKRVGQGFVEFGVSWTYYFQSASPLVEHPTPPPL
jgi:hypothetical protein